ncbi:putative glutathione S-transferase 5 [Holothuria leucospilota]|uniref:Glutathione S-transferase 5 n=1 Tax=Holothuria leucospilota TaxID=206669 RepID=A0A9Q0YHQ5_HOLLE|nr:putative glutathione S-transferase 5 [Holothuria leucospilota]
MPTYKLTYFNAKARGETARWIFALAGQEYEDNRIDLKDWPEVKKNFPFGQVPVLEVDGFVLAQSGAINRLLARRSNLYGDNDIEAAKIDQVCEALVDLGLAMRKYFHEKDESRKEETLKDLLENEAKKHFGFLVNLLDANGGNGFYVGNRVSLADVDSAIYLTDMVARVPGLKVTEPELLAHVEKIQSIPAIAEWLKKRPDTPF